MKKRRNLEDIVIIILEANRQLLDFKHPNLGLNIPNTRDCELPFREEGQRIYCFHYPCGEIRVFPIEDPNVTHKAAEFAPLGNIKVDGEKETHRKFLLFRIHVFNTKTPEGKWRTFTGYSSW
ncbi:hypothetical protein Avbf_15836 [Armadillidium vulgare]|nr:hypothetical protein Avbf_15836 [Armadillidium vulgare]